ncbi:Uncharacterised protein [Salmonella bongori]|nr:Uncharacterised protein [Salmonella bongori]
MPLLQKRHVLTLARRVVTCLIIHKKAYRVRNGESQKYSGLPEDRACGNEGQTAGKEMFCEENSKTTKNKGNGRYFLRDTT